MVVMFWLCCCGVAGVVVLVWWCWCDDAGVRGYWCGVGTNMTVFVLRWCLRGDACFVVLVYHAHCGLYAANITKIRK